MIVYFDKGFAAPIGKHTMPMHKFALVADELKSFSRVKLDSPPPVLEEDLLRVHDRVYLEAIKTGEPKALAESQKFPWSVALFDSVKLTNGGCLAAARQAMRDGISAALASGFHHSHSKRGEGFCTFNGLVVSLEAMRTAGEIKTAAILDLDLHYGNGTAQLVVDRPWIFAVSIYGNDYWDNTPYRDVSVRKHKDGENHRSLALPAESGRSAMLDALELGMSMIAERKPDIVLYQAGADPYFEDPYSTLKLDHSDLMERDRRVFTWAKRENIPIAWVLAGGYTPDVSKVVAVHVNTCRAALEIFK